MSHLEVDPVDGVADVLEHALIGHEKVTIFEASLTTTDSKNHVHIRVCTTGFKCFPPEPYSYHDRQKLETSWHNENQNFISVLNRSSYSKCHIK